MLLFLDADEPIRYRAGNLTWDINNALNFDGENQVHPASGLQYYYDGDGHRVAKSDGSRYWYDDNFNVLTTADSSNTLKKDYFYFNGARLGWVTISSGDAHYYLNNQLGSPSVIANGDGSVVSWESDYRPYGTKNLISNGDNLTVPYLFTGYEYDSEMGSADANYYANFRYYSSSLGRFFQPDPVGGDPTNPQSLNRYAYVLNSPLSFVDPFGLDCGQAPPDPTTSGFVVRVTVSRPCPDGGLAGPGGPWGNDRFTGSQCALQELGLPSPCVGEKPDSPGGPYVSQGSPSLTPDVPKSDQQIQKENACRVKALAAGGIAGAANFFGLPANFGSFGPSFAGTSPNGTGGVHVTAGDVALLLKEPTVQAGIVATAIKILPAAGATFAARAIPVLGWGLTLYQSYEALKAGVQQASKTFDACMRTP